MAEQHALGLEDENTEKQEMNEEKGLFLKYRVARVDGREELDADYFILRLDAGGKKEHTHASRMAILTYAYHISPTHPKLAKEIRARYGSRVHLFRMLNRWVAYDEDTETTHKSKSNQDRGTFTTALKNVIPIGHITRYKGQTTSSEFATSILSIMEDKLKADVSTKYENGLQCSSCASKLIRVMKTMPGEEGDAFCVCGKCGQRWIEHL